MKEEIGTVINFNGYTGRIKTDNEEYILLDNNIIKDEEINNGDIVIFIPEEINDVLIARYVRKKV